MLYITTKGNRDAFTSHRTLCTDIAPDDGYFLPMRFPHFSEGEIRSFVDGTFEETVAHILNVFFSAGLTKWDVGLCVGRNTAHVLESNPKVLIAELWHNSGNSFSYVINRLFHRIFKQTIESNPSEWFCIAVKIAVWFGVYGALCRQSLVKFGQRIDISVPADDFSYPISALYALEAGLPIGNIVCNCAESHEVWSLIHRGTMNTHGMDARLLAGIERYVLLRLGHSAVEHFRQSRIFEATADEVARLRKDMFCVVSGSDRIHRILNGVFTTSKRIVSPLTALCLAGLGDYRAKIGESRLTLVLEEDSPIIFAEQVETALGVTKKKLNNYLRE